MDADFDREFCEVRRRAQHARPVPGAPDHPCPCGARAGEYCRTCREILLEPVASAWECTCDLCTSQD